MKTRSNKNLEKSFIIIVMYGLSVAHRGAKTWTYFLH